MFGKSDQKVNKPRDGQHCDLCGCTFPAVRCDKCNSQIFCLSCDDMYHRHPRRRLHLRKAVDPISNPQARPVLPMKVSSLTLAPGDPSKMPLPPPRKKKSGKSIFDTFRRGSPSSDLGPNKKEYTWSDRMGIGNIKKFMSSRPLPPVPDNTAENSSNNNEDSTNQHNLSFIHKRVDEEPPALPQRTVQKPHGNMASPFQQEIDNNNFESSQFQSMAPMPHANSPNVQNLKGVPAGMQSAFIDRQGEWTPQNDFISLPSQPPVSSFNQQGFSTLHYRGYTQNQVSPLPSDKSGGMHQSSSVTDLTSLPSGMSAPGIPFYPYPFPPQMQQPYPNQYPMYPPYPPYAPYFGRSWMNLSSPPQTTDLDMSDQSDVGGKHDSHMEKSAKRSRSVMVDRMQVPGHFYPFGPMPPMYGPPWLTGQHMEMPSSPSPSVRSLSCSHSHRQNRQSDDDGVSSSHSRPKSSSSEVPKKQHRRHKSQTSSSSGDDVPFKHSSKTKFSPRLSRKQMKDHALKKRCLSPKQMSSVSENKPTDTQSDRLKEVSQVSVTRKNQQPKHNMPKSKCSEAKESSDKVETAAWTPPNEWECQHCTFVNSAGQRICQVCYKTASKPKDEEGSERVNGENLYISNDQCSEAKQSQASNSSSRKQEMANLNSALDEAEKEINRGLEELLKIEDEVPITQSENDAKLDSNGSLNVRKHNFNNINSNSVKISSTSIQAGNETNKRQNSSCSDRDLSIPTANDSNIPLRISSVQMFPNNENFSNALVTASKSSTQVTGQLKESKDSFCQTQQTSSDINQEKTETTSFLKKINRIKYSPSRMNHGQHSLLDSSFNSTLQEMPYHNGYGQLNRANSSASLFAGRRADGTQTSLDYGKSAVSPLSMVRSLSRASLLGDSDPWQADLRARHRPDFYLSMEELVERRRQETMRAQGLELVQMIREAEQLGFTADDIQIALNNCGKQNPVIWLQDNWKNVISTVVTLASNYGREQKENDVGLISENEARDALRLHKGNIWASVTECVEGRQRKCLELSARGSFTFKEIIDALTSSDGNVEIAYAQLTNTTLNPFLMQIWGSGDGVQNLEGFIPQPVNLKGYGVQLHDVTSKGSEDSEQEMWEEYDEEEDQGWDAEEDDDIGHADVSKSPSHNFENDFERYSRDRICKIQTPDSDPSDYCDAYSPGLSQRYLSATSIDEIYLVGVSGDDEELEMEKITQDNQTRKPTGFLTNLAALRRSMLDLRTSNNEDGMMHDSEQKSSGIADINLERKDSSGDKSTILGFRPLNLLKQTFSAFKETVSGINKPEKNNSTLSISEKRTIIVNDSILQQNKTLTANLAEPIVPEIARVEYVVSQNANQNESVVSESTNQNVAVVRESTNQNVAVVRESTNQNESVVSEAAKSEHVVSKHANQNGPMDPDPENQNSPLIPVLEPPKNSVATIPANEKESASFEKNINESMNLQKCDTSQETEKFNNELPGSVESLEKIKSITEFPHPKNITQEFSERNIQSLNDVKTDDRKMDLPVVFQKPNTEYTGEDNAVTLDLSTKASRKSMNKPVSMTGDILSSKLNPDVSLSSNESHIKKIESKTIVTESDALLSIKTDNVTKISDIPESLKSKAKLNQELPKHANEDPSTRSEIKIIPNFIESEKNSKAVVTNEVEQFNKEEESSTNANLLISNEISQCPKILNGDKESLSVQEIIGLSELQETHDSHVKLKDHNSDSKKFSTAEKMKTDKKVEIVSGTSLLRHSKTIDINTSFEEHVNVNHSKKLNTSDIADITSPLEVLVKDSSTSNIAVEKEMENHSSKKCLSDDSKVNQSDSSVTVMETVNVRNQTIDIVNINVDIIQHSNLLETTAVQMFDEPIIVPNENHTASKEILNTVQRQEIDIMHNGISNENRGDHDPQKVQNASQEQDSVIENTIPQIHSSAPTPKESENIDVSLPNHSSEAVNVVENLEMQNSSDVVINGAVLELSPPISKEKDSEDSNMIKNDVSSQLIISQSAPEHIADVNTHKEQNGFIQAISSEEQSNVSHTEDINNKKQKNLDSDGELENIKDKNLEESSSVIPQDQPSSDDMDSEDTGFPRSVSPVRPIGTFRRMSFNTRKEAIFQERHKATVHWKTKESKPWFTQKKIEPIVPILPKRSLRQQLEFERKVRKMVSDKKCRTYRKAEVIIQLLDLNFEENEAIYAANECNTLEQAISFLQQDCELCAGKYPIGEIISMVHCSHKACKECIKAYFTIQIRDRTIMELLCPFCNEPDITDEDVAQDYFNHLDIMLKKLVDVDIHELFQRKLRDRVLMKDPNFRWCPQCSSGFITDPNLKRLMCPDCNAITCAFCRRVWEREHEGVSCAMFAAWKDACDPEAQAAGLAKILTEDGIDCPCCHFRYALAKGGCMHFKCMQCQHDFCSGCSQPFKMGQKCGLSEFCVKLGLHAHHPRNCLFYLRDKEPTDLQKLLDMNEIEYNKDPPSGMEVKNLCQVLEQKETSHGMIDDNCGKDVQAGFAGLCRLHYVEYLGQLVNKHKIDPIHVFENDDLELVLKRVSIRLPPKKYRESSAEYRDKLINLIEEKLPLCKIEGS